MSRDRFQLTDPYTCSNETDVSTMPDSHKRKGGCHVSGALGAALTLLAVLIAVGVGIIVHFAEGDRDVTCYCDGSRGTAAGTAEFSRQECIDTAKKGDSDICGSCPVPTVPIPTESSTDLPDSKVKDVRLPDALYPEHYDVRLHPDFYGKDPSKFTFSGSVRMTLRCNKATDNVTVHVNVLKVDEQSIVFREEGSGTQDNVPHHVSTQYDQVRQFMILKLSHATQVGKTYVVEMNFTSPLKDDLKGLYYSTYSRDGQTVYLVTTQMQATDARKTFPCMDEPALKSTFNITLVRASTLTSISNMPIIDQSETWTENGLTMVADVYKRTPKMSTYLLAFVISDFQFIQNTTTNGIQYRTFARPDAVNDSTYALDCGVKILTYFENFFEVEYPLPKQDMIAIPDFSAGAMENWGLITYRETAMLFKPGVSNEYNRERVAVVVSHELAHQWFGDLVTPSWWDDLWLNEGFASYVEYLGVDHIHPDWNMLAKFVVSDLQDAFKFDGLRSSHPVYVPVDNPDSISEIFDTISYAKGASIIRMMDGFLGTNTFKKGLKLYLTERMYSDAFHDDLWSALTRRAKQDGLDIDVKAVMDTWTLQMNYPVVTVKRDFYKSNTVHVTQERYLIDKDAKDPGRFTSPFQYRWTIPLTFTYNNDPKLASNSVAVNWMYHNEISKAFSFPGVSLPNANDSNGWILANVHQKGYYRVNYHEENWKKLSQQLMDNHMVIPVENRAQIINDAWNLVASGQLSIRIALKTIEYLDKEEDYVPWTAAVTALGYVNSMLALSPVKGAFRNFMRERTEKPFAKTGLNNTGATHTESFLRALIAGRACAYGIQGCLVETTRQFSEWMADPQHNRIDPILKSKVYCSAVRNGGWEEWKFALEAYKNETVASEKARLLGALSCTQQPWILNHYLHLVLQPNSPIRRQDSTSVINYVSSETVGQPLAWDFFRANYGVLYERFGTSSFSWSRVIGSVTGGFNTQFHLDEISRFEATNSGKLGSGARAFQQAKEKVSANMKWMTNNLHALRDYLSEKGYN